MSRYFFHIDDGNAAQDEVGVELETLADAKCEAVKFAGQLICDAGKTFWAMDHWTLTATDERGLTLFVLQFIGTEAPVIRAELVSPKAV
ncbi:MAG TPA: hypothetical protein VEZ20_01280 [Allosphingosinicella sp.]|jgi:hypothetical protein|nr:hypothetical protein [Allosphingosinicella sp.]